MNVWLVVLLSMHQASDLKYIDPNFKTDPSWQEVKAENADAQDDASTAAAPRAPNPEIPEEALQGVRPRRVPKLHVDGSTYGFSPVGLHEYCNDNFAACTDDPLRRIVTDVDRSIGVMGVSILLGLVSIITVRVATDVCLSASGCSRTTLGVDIGAAAAALLSIGASFYTAHRVQRDLEIWRETAQGTVEHEVAGNGQPIPAGR